MSLENHKLQLPSHDDFANALAILALPISGSELHGIMCGYLCAGAIREGEYYLSALSADYKDSESRRATLMMFEIYSLSQQQLSDFNFNFQLLLPSEKESLATRAQAFSEWCAGFIQALELAGINSANLDDEDTEDIFQHLSEFAQLDYGNINVDEEDDDDENAFMEVSEYARMSIVSLYHSLHSQHKGQYSNTTH